MDKYKKYMDSIEASAEFREKLKGLDSPKRSAVWQKYGALAAALVLVVGLGVLGVHGDRPQAEQGGPELSEPDIDVVVAPVPSGSPVTEPAGVAPTMGGYEVREGEVVSYFYLPHILYGEIDAPVETEMDMALPVGVYRRDLTQEELFALFGGEQSLSTHLRWSGYELYAFAMLNQDGSLWRLYVGGMKGDTGYEHFSLEVMPGEIPASCYVYGEGVSNMIFGKEVLAERYDGEQVSYRRVAFMHEGYGYRFEITGQDTEMIVELVSRAVRYILAGDGLLVNTTTCSGYDGEAVPAPDAGYSVGEPNYEDGATTSPYDPSEK